MSDERQTTNDERRGTQHATRNTQPSAELHIEELMLYGFTPGDRYRIGDAVERELARLFIERGMSPWLAQGGEIAHLDGETFEVAVGSKPEAIGAQIAQAVYGGLAR